MTTMDKVFDSSHSLHPELRTNETPSAFIVLDTNFLLSNLTLVQSVQAWHSKYRHVILIPWTVIEERNYPSTLT